MAFLPGNFLYRTAINTHYRALMIPWLKRSSGIIYCAKGRGYSYSNSPIVKYMPRKAVKNEGNVVTSLPVRPLEERGFGRFGFFNESGSSVMDADSDGDDECLPSFVNCWLNLVERKSEGDFTAVTDEVTEDPEKSVDDNNNNNRCCGIPSDRGWQDVQNSAIKLLASRAFTAVELKKKLQGKSFQHETIDAVISDFQSRGLINDCLYAEAYARSRWTSLSWGPRRIRQALLKKGVSEADAEKAMKVVFENSSEGDEEEESGIGMSKVCTDQLYEQAWKQWQKSDGASQEIRKSRMVRWLQYRGFNWNVIKYVLNKLESA